MDGARLPTGTGRCFPAGRLRQASWTRPERVAAEEGSACPLATRADEDSGLKNFPLLISLPGAEARAARISWFGSPCSSPSLSIRVSSQPRYEAFWLTSYDQTLCALVRTIVTGLRSRRRHGAGAEGAVASAASEQRSSTLALKTVFIVRCQTFCPRADGGGFEQHRMGQGTEPSSAESDGAA